jgi:hypothetical protein
MLSKHFQLLVNPIIVSSLGFGLDLISFALCLFFSVGQLEYQTSSTNSHKGLLLLGSLWILASVLRAHVLIFHNWSEYSNSNFWMVSIIRVKRGEKIIRVVKLVLSKVDL